MNTGFGAAGNGAHQARRHTRSVLQRRGRVRRGGRRPAAGRSSARRYAHPRQFALKGFSGVRPVVVETIISMLNAGVTPLVPSKGSLGASGDLAPLAHIAMVLAATPEGLADDSGFAFFQGECLNGHEAMARAGIAPVFLEAKEAWP